MKNGEVLELYIALDHIKENKSAAFPIEIGYQFIQNLERIRPTVQDIVWKRNIISSKPIDEDEKKREINKLMEEEANITIIKVPLDMFEGLVLNIEDTVGLLHMVEI